MPLLPLQVQVLTLWTVTRDRMIETARNAGDERGELTANVVFLAALALAAVGVAAIVISRLNSNAEKIPGG